jgi:hypothetical protein
VIRHTLRLLVVACAAILLTQSPLSASAADGGALLPNRPPTAALRVSLLVPDIYLDRGGKLAILTEECQEPAAVDTDVLLRLRADSDEPELAFPSGQACPVSFVGNDNAYFTSATDGGYTDVYTGLSVRTADCPEVSSVEPALVRYNLVILMGDQPSVCHLAV